MRKTWALVMAAAMAAASLTACSSSKPAETAAPETEAEAAETEETEAEATGDQQEILVAAAASLQYVMEDKIQPAFENLGMWDDVEAKTSFGTNVTEVLSWVAAGSADAGIVYLTDATTSDQFDQVKVIGYAPEGSVSKVIYPVGVVSASTKKDAAQKFVDYLGTDDALSFFAEYGFTANK